MKKQTFYLKTIFLAITFISSAFAVFSQTEEKQEEIFIVVESMPEYPGGLNAMYTFIADNLQYPPMAIENKTEGKVYINFVIEPDGSISNVRALRGVSPLLDAEAIRVVKMMPKWSPGIQKGKPVRVSYNLPIKFTL